MDHGILNVPLSKRGNIDAQLDVYKAQQAAESAAKRKAQAATMREQKAAAKVALAEIKSAPGLLDAKAAKMGRTVKELLAVLDSWSKWEPTKLLKLRSEWIAN